MRIVSIGKRVKRKKTKVNPKKRKPAMAKKRKRRKNPKRRVSRRAKVVVVNPRKKRRKSVKRRRRNPVVIHHRKRRRHNPKFNVKGILEQLKPIAFGAIGALVLAKGISMIPLKPEQEKFKPWIKLGLGVGIASMIKHPIAKLGGIFVATLAVRDMIAEKFPTLVAGTDDYYVEGEDYEDQLLGGQVSLNGSQVSMNGEGRDAYATGFDGY